MAEYKWFRIANNLRTSEIHNLDFQKKLQEEKQRLQEENQKLKEENQKLQEKINKYNIIINKTDFTKLKSVEAIQLFLDNFNKNYTLSDS